MRRRQAGAEVPAGLGEQHGHEEQAEDHQVLGQGLHQGNNTNNENDANDNATTATTTTTTTTTTNHNNHTANDDDAPR